jgi:hypothetical protein
MPLSVVRMQLNAFRTLLNTFRIRFVGRRTEFVVRRMRFVGRRTVFVVLRTRVDTSASDCAAVAASLNTLARRFVSGARCFARRARSLRICGAYIDASSIRLAYNIKKRIDLTVIPPSGSNT